MSGFKSGEKGDFRVGDYVKEKTGKKRRGRVVSIEGSNLTVDIGEKENVTAAKTNYEKTRNTMSGKQFKEVLINSLLFGGIQLIRKDGMFGHRSVNFLVSDAAYEFLLKGFIENMVPFVRPDGIPPEDKRKFFQTSDFKNGIGKALPVVLLMQLYGMGMHKHKFSANIGKNIIDASLAITVGNVIDRKFIADKKKVYNY